ncbi:MAG: C-terminal helicase domain-containing protein, partial [Acidobacteriota bacterium]
FRTLGNLPETIALLRPGRRAGPYWQRLVSHGIDGNLQAVLDEQVHMLVDALGQRPAPPAVRAAEVADALADALAIRTAPITIDELKPHPRQGRIEIKPLRVRCRFALRFDELKDEQERTLARADTVRQAFNSPFRPFVLASTSIGQEGLDFHTWCHAVVHWNLPSNPVDLEQREGRVQRFKGHAVRKNVARAFGLPGLAAWSRRGDPWDHLFDLARQSRPPDATDLVPYWLYELDGGARIERRVPMLPLSREVTRLGALKRSLAVYRLALGQPRQEDLLEFLGRVGNGDGHPLFVPYRIGMEP